MFNPRFPHTLRIERPKKIEGEIVFDDDGNPTYETVLLDIVQCDASGNPIIGSDGRFLTEQADTINFGYRTSSQNTRTAGDVEVADFKIALPMFITPVFSGDRLIVEDYDRIYIGRVVKKTTFNLGSNIWFNEVRN